MRDIFLPGPFAEPDMIAAVSGAADPPRATPARLEDHGFRADRAGARLALVASPGEGAPGGLVRVGAEEAARLGFVLAAMAGGAAPVRVRVAGRAAEAWVADRGDWGAPWPAAPEPEWRAHLAEAAGEIAAFHGARDAEAAAELVLGASYRALARLRGAAERAPVHRRRGYAAADVERIGLARPYARYFAVEAHRLRHRRFDGRMSEPIDRAVFVSGDAVSVLPFDPVRRSVLLIEQFRAGPFARRDPHPWCLEAVAGRCDPGEGPMETARREAREEAGVTLGRMERIAAYYPSPGMLAEHITAYVGEADLGAAGGVHGLAQEDEDIRVLTLPLAEALGLAASGEANNAPLLISLLWLGREAERLVRDWAG